MFLNFADLFETFLNSSRCTKCNFVFCVFSDGMITWVLLSVIVGLMVIWLMYKLVRGAFRMTSK